MTPFTFNTSPSIQFGPGRLDDIAEFAGNMGKQVLIVTDLGLLATGIVERAQEKLHQAGIGTTIYSDVTGDPPEQVVLEAAAAADGASGVIGLGGGSSLDVAKLASVLARKNQTLSDIYGIGNVTGGRLPLMLVPTTSGTGSEVTPISIITTGANEKMGVVSPVILPDVALLDPELTFGLPAPVTAATGIDAMVHAIEAYASASPNNNPISRGLATQALGLMAAALETAVHQGTNAAARYDMMLGSMLAGQAFANSPVAAVHALAYPIGGHFKVPHGLSNALILPHVLRFNIETTPEPYAELLRYAFPDRRGGSPQKDAETFADCLAELSQRCGLPQHLRDVEITADDLDLLARDAMNQTRLLVNNPRDVTQNDARTIYEAAL